MLTPPQRHTLRKRGCPATKEVTYLKIINGDLEARLASAMQHIEAIGANYCRLLREKNKLLTQQVNRLWYLISNL